ncbi:hypothetical protein E1B28_003767 [Marasmius oreades]|uniref:Uncharacterized protein n=1 Tax=Marasmius oreades TaxID=181124 RepID=A0A9P7UX82_9AGAR|nr:uncharacterized protein E1B28_003767 [Marasmius oreades]KAG7096323.1 hypothetical protein E1B28_003767 [Marasmius oreades]
MQLQAALSARCLLRHPSSTLKVVSLAPVLQKIVSTYIDSIFISLLRQSTFRIARWILSSLNDDIERNLRWMALTPRGIVISDVYPSTLSSLPSGFSFSNAFIIRIWLSTVVSQKDSSNQKTLKYKYNRSRGLVALS